MFGGSGKKPAKKIIPVICTAEWRQITTMHRVAEFARSVQGSQNMLDRVNPVRALAVRTAGFDFLWTMRPANISDVLFFVGRFRAASETISRLVVEIE